MKKTSFLFGAAVLMMTSCSSDEVVDMATTQAIGFNSFMNNSTRASGTATDLVQGNTPEERTFNSFDVWAVRWNDTQAPSQVFVAQPVNLSSGGLWEYTPARYWVANDNYRFTALAPSGAKGVTVQQSTDAITDFDAVKGGLKINFNNGADEGGAAAAVDLCIATNKVQKASAAQPAVEMQFSHMLSRVKFTFKNTFESEQSVLKIEGVQITNATKEASLNSVLGETLWTANGTSYGMDFTLAPASGMDNTVINGGHEQVSHHQYVIPIAAEKTYHVYFKVTLMTFDSGKYTNVGTWEHTIDLPIKQFVNNYSYNFIAEINNENVNPNEQMYPIEFSPSISNWETFGDNPIVHEHPGTTPGTN